MVRAATVKGMIQALADIQTYSQVIVGTPLREYQLRPCRAIIQSIAERAGRQFVVTMPRQSGKNEMSAQLEAYLLTRLQLSGATLIKAAPTFKPQIVNSIRRLRDRLNNPLTEQAATPERGYILTMGKASITFFSAAPSAQVVGATGGTLMECDEAQDVEPDKWDKDFRPMGSTGNATTVLYGTPWTEDDLLARSIQECQRAEERDGIRRVFEVDYLEVGESNPAYLAYVEAEITRLGASHPIVQTQYLMKRLPRAGRYLNLDQLEALQGSHQPTVLPADGKRYVASIDVAGEDEDDPDAMLTKINPKRDSTVLTIAEVETQQIGQAVEPVLKIASITAWIGTKHRTLYPTILALLKLWRVERAVVDATGLGAGLAAFLSVALGEQRVEAFKFTQASKSELAYGLLAAINGDRVKLYAESEIQDANERRRELLHQAAAADYELRGQQAMAFSVPESRGHDDHLMSLALLPRAASWAARRRASGRQRQASPEQPFGQDIGIRR